MSRNRSVSELDRAIKLIGAVLLGVAVVLGAAVTGITILGSEAISVSPSGIGTLAFGLVLAALVLLVGRSAGRERGRIGG